MSAVIITGATRGIGKVIANYFLTLGYNVIICSKSRESCEHAKSELSPFGERVFVTRADVSQENEVKDLIEKSLKRYQKIDVLINNAGIYGPVGKTHANDSMSWTHAMSVNCFSVFYMCKHIIPHMMQNNFGRIINLSGGGATMPMPQYSAYSASKAAVVRLTETLALELPEYGITVNAIAPGFIATDIHQTTLEAGEEIAGEVYQKTRARLSSGGDDPVRTAKLAAFLASKQCRITGKLISAVYDDWQNLSTQGLSENLYTLRRIDNRFFGELENE